MRGRIKSFLRRIFRWITGRPTKSPSVGRIRKVLSTSGMRQKQGFAPGIWSIKANSFTDAYRLLLLLGRQDGLTCMKIGGHIRYHMLLPDDSGYIILSDRVGHRSNTLAVMLFYVDMIPEIKEIRFRHPSESVFVK